MDSCEVYSRCNLTIPANINVFNKVIKWIQVHVKAGIRTSAENSLPLDIPLYERLSVIILAAVKKQLLPTDSVGSFTVDQERHKVILDAIDDMIRDRASKCLKVVFNEANEERLLIYGKNFDSESDFIAAVILSCERHQHRQLSTGRGLPDDVRLQKIEAILDTPGVRNIMRVTKCSLDNIKKVMEERFRIYDKDFPSSTCIASAIYLESERQTKNQQRPCSMDDAIVKGLSQDQIKELIREKRHSNDEDIYTVIGLALADILQRMERNEISSIDANQVNANHLDNEQLNANRISVSHNHNQTEGENPMRAYTPVYCQAMS